MIIETGSVISAIAGKIPVTGTKLIKLIDQFNGILHRCCTGIGTKISGTVFLHLSGKQNSWILLPHSNLNIGVGFIILEHGVVLGTMLLDQIVFQHQCFQLRVRDNIFKSADQGNHLVYLRSPSDVLAKIGSDTVMQVNCFPDINNVILVIMHDINSRTIRQLFQFLLNIKHL